ncbi:MAG: hypothetical protein QOG10_3404 [Kribbellaceae bacterium]|nr:hypothetical protein [Kribbellaceae bacterium]
MPVPTNTLRTSTPTDAAVAPQLPEEATAPPPAVAGPVTARNLPAASSLGAGWKTYIDPGGAEKGFIGNKTWTRRRDGQHAAYESLPVGCANPLPSGSLPVPEHALQGSYRTPSGGPATVLVLRFSQAGKASSYYRGYQARMTACGAGTEGLAVQRLWSKQSTAASVRRYAGEGAYVEVSALQGSTVALLAAKSAKPDGQVAWTHTVVPVLQAVIDRP